VRVAVLCPSYGEYAGIGTIADALGSEFHAAGTELALICRPDSPRTGAFATAPRLELPLHQMPRRWHQLRRQARFAALLARIRPPLRCFLDETRTDVLLTLGISTYAPVAIVASRLVPVVVSLPGGEPDGRFVAHPAVFRHLLRRARGVAACASSLARQAAALEPGVVARLHVIPNGVAPRVFAEATPYRHERPYLFAAGRFTRQKGFDVLLDALAHVEAVRRGTCDLLVAGSGPEARALETQARALGIDARVRFVGAMDTARLASLYRGALAVVVPSRWEGLPLVCLEAMASGRPIVGSRVDGIPDAVADGETGLLVPPEDAAALAGALGALVGDPSRADRMGAAARARAAALFAWPLVAARYLSVLRAAAGA